MFKNEFQGGPYFEVFSAQGKDPTSHWKVTGGSGIRKEFDRNVKSFVYILDGCVATTKMQLPRDPRQSLTLIQRYLVFQLYVPKGQDFSIDIGIQDMAGSKRRLFLSTAHKETHTTPLHSKIPLGILCKDTWLNLCLDMLSLVSETWHGQSYKSTESVCVSANCRMRRIFTMKVQPPDTSQDEELYGFTGTNDVELETIPKQCQLALDVPQVTQVLNMTKLYHYEGKDGPTERNHLRQSSNPELGLAELNTSSLRKSASGENYHIAFGTKVSGTQRKGSGNKEGSTTSRSLRPMPGSTRLKPEGSGEPLMSSRAAKSSRIETTPAVGDEPISARERKNSDPGTKQVDPEVTVDKDSLKTSHTWTDGADGKEDIPFVRPHPPREPSSDRARRKPRVKSAGKERTPCTPLAKDDVHRNSSAGSTSGHQRAGSGSQDNYRGGSGQSDGRRTGSGQSDGRRTSSGQSDGRRAGSGQSEGRRVDSGHRDHHQASTHDGHRSGSGHHDSQRAGSYQPKNIDRSPKVSHKNNSESDSLNTSEPLDDDGDDEDSLTDVINALKSHDGFNPKEYEDTESDGDLDEDDEEDIIYTFRSPPKSAPRHMVHSSNKVRKSLPKVQKHHIQNLPMDSKTRSTDSRSKEARLSERRTHDHRRYKSRGAAQPDSDLFQSSEEEENMKARLRASRLSSNAHVDGARSNSDANKDIHHGENGRLLHVPSPIAISSPSGSQSRRSISRKSLREIPKDDVRLSTPQKPYNVTKYQMEDLSESFERQMLLSLRRETMEDALDDENENGGPQPNNMSRLHYGDDSLSDSSDDTSSMSTLKAQRGHMKKSHNYQDEMKMASAQLTHDFLNQSNPRDWGNVFSPPIVLPSSKPATETLPPPSSKIEQSPKAEPVNRGKHITDGNESNEEEELDLLYDPVLNCYFDPHSCKYYELI